MSMTADLIPYSENACNSGSGGKGAAAGSLGKRGLAVRPGAGAAAAAGAKKKPRKAKRSGIPPPRVHGTPSGAAKSSSSASSSRARRSAAKKPKTPLAPAAANNNNAAAAAAAAATPAGGRSLAAESIAASLSSHRALLETLRNAVIDKPALKGLSKTNYKGRLSAFEESYRSLRRAAGEYQKQAREYLDRVERVEKSMARELRASTAEADQLRSSCESFEQEMGDAHRQLETVRAEHAALKTAGAKLEARAAELSARVKELEAETKAQQADNAGLAAKCAGLETRSSDLAAQLEQASAQARADLERVQADLTEQHASAAAAMTARVADLQASLEGVRQQLQVAQASATSFQAKFEGAGERAAALAAELAAKAAKLQESTITEVKQTAEIGHLKSSLAAKEKEMERAMEGLRHTQQMSERRVDELSVEKKDLAAKRAELEAQRRALEAESTQLKSDLDATRRDLEAAVARGQALDASEAELKQGLADQTAARAAADGRVAQLDAELKDTREKLAQTTQALATLQREHDALALSSRAAQEKLETQVAAQTTRADTAEAGLAASQQKADELSTSLKAVSATAGQSAQEQTENLMRLSVECENLKKRLGVDKGVDLLSQAQARVAELEARLFKGETERKRLHNKVQELRGNVRVAVRVRPLLGAEPEAEAPELRDAGGAVRCNDHDGAMELSIVSGAGAGKRMSFDRVFGPRCDQANVFEEVSELVQSALDGYNVCIFAYGQTGSGKTHTMQGGTQGESRGIIPRAIAQILETSQRMNRDDGWEFTIKASFLEIYNEEINDLLEVGGAKRRKAEAAKKKQGSMSRGSSSSSSSSASSASGPSLVIRQQESGMVVDGMHEVELTHFGQLQGIVDRAAKNRR